MSTSNHNVSDTTGSDNTRIARQERILLTRWKQTTEAEEVTKLLRVLRKEKVGLHEMEVVVTKQLKARKVGGGTFKRRGELLEILFTEKLDDSMRQEVKRRRRRALDRIKLEGMLGGPKSRRSRT